MFEKILSMLGAAVSIGSACWALIQARRAAKAATKAEGVRDEIIDRRKLIEISQVHSETSRILTKVAKVGPASRPELLLGFNCSELASEVADYLRFLNENSYQFNEPLKGKASLLCATLQGDIETLSDVTNSSEIKSIGKAIYYKINAFLPIVKESSDSIRENINVKD